MGDESTIRCPRCGFEQPSGPECGKCGVVFAKLQARPANDAGGEAQRASAPEPAPAQPRMPRSAEQPMLDPLDQPIGHLAWAVRGLAVVVCFGVAAVLFSSGRALHSFALYGIAIFYAFFGLWVVASLGTRPPTRRFAIEMLVLVFASLAFRVAFPEVFTLEEGRRGGTVAVATPSAALGRLALEGQAVVGLLETAVRQGKLPAGMRQARLRDLLELQTLERLRAEASATQRGAFLDAYTALREAVELVRKAVRGPVLPGAPVDLDDDTRAAVATHLREARRLLAALATQ